MKAELRKAKSIRMTIRKVLYFLLIIVFIFFTAVWGLAHYPQIEKRLSRFIDVPIETSEVDSYYNLLLKHKQQGKKLIYELDVSENDNLQVAIEKLKIIMGLNNCVVGLDYHKAATPPAYINNQDGDMTIFISTYIKDRREQINLLAHELSHIYVWRLNPSIFGKSNQEKLVDCASVFLGLGILTLNGFTDEYALLPEGGYKTQQKNFGYLKPEQFGYLLARYCSENKIDDKPLKKFLNPAGWKYFQFGNTYIKKLANNGSSVAKGSILYQLIEASRKITQAFSNLAGKLPQLIYEEKKCIK